MTNNKVKYKNVITVTYKFKKIDIFNNFCFILINLYVFNKL